MKLIFDMDKKKIDVEGNVEKLVEKGIDNSEKGWKEKFAARHNAKKELMEIKHSQKIELENSEGETLEVTGNENEVNSVSNEIDSCVDDYNIEKSMRMNKKNVRVRLDENIYKSAASLSVTIYVIILIAAIFILIVSLLILKIK